LIEQLFREGNTFSVSPFRVYYVCGEKIFKTAEVSSPLRFAVGVSARNFKKAVDRNRIKRLTREAYRLQKETLLVSLGARGLQLAVFFIFTGKEVPVYKAVYEKITACLQKLVKEIS
jgi:ribonuclease P protein component